MNQPYRKFTTEGQPPYAPWQKGICQHCNMHEAEKDSDFCAFCAECPKENKE